MTLRNRYTADQHRAAAILDLVRNGITQPRHEILWALLTLGESI